MKTIKTLSVAVLVGIGFSAFAGKMVDGEHKVLSKESQVTWVGEKVTGQHEGTVNIMDGELIVENGELSGGSFEMDMKSIAVTDIQGEYQQKLEGHLKSDDFFGVEKYPTAKYVITSVKKESNGQYKVAGKMTIKDVTKQVEFMADLKEEKENIVGTASIVIDRADFNVRYGSGSFFDNLGDNMIYDDFTLNVNLIAN